MRYIATRLGATATQREARNAEKQKQTRGRLRDGLPGNSGRSAIAADKSIHIGYSLSDVSGKRPFTRVGLVVRDTGAVIKILKKGKVSFSSLDTLYGSIHYL